MESEQKKSKVGMIVMWIVVLAIVGVFVVPKIIHPPPDRFRDNQKDPENALKIYLETAYGFLQIREGCGFMEMEKVVTAGDWQWYNDNWQTLFHDDFNLKSGANPGDAAAIGKRMALNEILEGGACSPSNEVIQKDIHDTEAVFVVRAKDVESRSQTDFKVHVVKEGRYWKVQGFAGGRARVEGTSQPGDVVYGEMDFGGKGKGKGKGKETVSTSENPKSKTKPSKEVASADTADPGDNPLDAINASPKSALAAEADSDSAAAKPAGEEDSWGTADNSGSSSEHPAAKPEADGDSATPAAKGAAATEGASTLGGADPPTEKSSTTKGKSEDDLWGSADNSAAAGESSAAAEPADGAGTHEAGSVATDVPDNPWVDHPASSTATSEAPTAGDAKPPPGEAAGAQGGRKPSKFRAAFQENRGKFVEAISSAKGTPPESAEVKPTKPAASSGGEKPAANHAPAAAPAAPSNSDDPFASPAEPEAAPKSQATAANAAPAKPAAAPKPAAPAPASAGAKGAAPKGTGGKAAAGKAAAPEPAAMMGETVPAGPVDPAVLAPADALIKQAAADWDKGKYKESVINAEKALTIYSRHLGPNHPKIVRVKKMIEQAKAKAGEN